MVQDFIAGFLVCTLIFSPFLTYFVLKEIAWRHNLNQIKKIAESKTIEAPKPVEVHTLAVLSEAEEILKDKKEV